MGMLREVVMYFVIYSFMLDEIVVHYFASSVEFFVQIGCLQQDLAIIICDDRF